MLVLRLALRALRWRAGSAATIFVIALIAVLAATVGPVYLHALDEAVTAAHLRRAPLSQREVVVSRNTLIGYGSVEWDAQVRALTDELARSDFFRPAVAAETVGVSYPGSNASSGPVAAIDELCPHLHLMAGRCVGTGSSGDDAVISEHTAALYHLAVGGHLSAEPTAGPALRLTVVGIYASSGLRSAFWQPWAAFFRYGQAPPDDGLPYANATFVTHQALAARVRDIQETVAAVVTLQTSRVGYDDLPALRATITHLQARVTSLSDASGSSGVPVATVTTVLPAVIDRTTTETSLARTLVTVATAQLALLAILVLYAVLAGTSGAQGPEVALAKLRGRRSRSVLVQSVAQPVLLVVAATPVAALLAWLIVRLLASTLLGRPVAVVFPAAAAGIAALTAVGGILAAVVAARRIVVTPVGALLRRGAAPSGSRLGLVIADAVGVTVAVAGLVELKEGGVLDAGSPNPLAVLAPTLIALGLAIVVLRLLPLAGRRVAAATRDSRRVASFLAARQLLRRPAELRAVLLVAVALSIAAFAVTNWTDARDNRAARALNAAGADTILLVRPGAGVDDLRTAVDRADPSGDSMAVAYSEADQLPPLLAVDTARFAKVAAWVPSNAAAPLGNVLHRLRKGLSDPVAVRGTRLQLAVDLLQRPAPRVRLEVTLSEPTHVRVQVGAAIPDGTSTHVLTLPSACDTGCEITALHFTANTPAQAYAPQGYVIAATVAASVPGAGTARPVAGFAAPDRWQGDGNGRTSIGSSGSALRVEVRQSTGTAAWPAVDSTAIPAALPAVVASDTAARNPGDALHSLVAVGLDGQSVDVDGVVRSVTLPRVDRSGVLVDFGAATAAMTDVAGTTTQYQVWLSPSAPADMTERLAHQHVRVVGRIEAATYRRALDESGPAYADSLFLVAALAATVLAIGAAAVGRVVSTKRRSYELAALEAVGVAPRTLRRATAVEQGVVLIVGLVVGLGAGLVGSQLALPSTPVFVDTATGPPLVFFLPWTLLVVLAIALVVVFVVVSIAVAALVERAASPIQLRGAQQ